MSTFLLDKLLDPRSIAVIGASDRENSPGFKLSRNLLRGSYSGTLYLVNPKYKTVLDQPCYKSVKALPETPDLAILILPSQLLRKTLVQCSRKGIHVAVIMSGTTKSQALHRYAERLGMRLMGPYCAGLIRPHLGLNATYSENHIEKGNLAIISQSAALGAAMVDWAETSKVGFSALLSTGLDTDISLSDLVDLLAEDWQTKAIIIYVDKITATRSFLSALSAAARIKPVVLMRSSQQGATFCDALARTGQVYNSDAVFQAALNRVGVVRIRTFSNLYAAAEILSTGIRVKGNRLAIISNASAPALMALERITDKQFQAPHIEQADLRHISRRDRANIVGSNPILLRDPLKLCEHMRLCIESMQSISYIDAVLVIFVPDSRNDPNEVALTLADCQHSKKLLLSCWMGDASVGIARDTLSKAGVPTFTTPEDATDGFDFLHRYYISQQQLLQLPNPTSRSSPVDATSARRLVKTELKAGQRVLDPMNTRALMQLFDIPMLRSGRAISPDEAIQIARQIGFPVAMKLVSPNISYKAAVVSSQLNLKNDREVRQAWQLIETRLRTTRPEAVFTGVLVEAMHTPPNPRSMALSISHDPMFGPIISLGVGGELTALIHERRVQLPPLNRFLIKDIIDDKGFQVYLGAFRHTQAVSAYPLAHILRRVSELACEIPEVFSLDINPLVLSGDGAIAMDVQVVLEKSPHRQRYKHLAIHPYPLQWVRDVNLKDGSQIQLRPIRPTDAESLQSMVKHMSAESRFFRFMHAMNELSPQMTAQFTKLDYDRQMAFVATNEKYDAPRSHNQPQAVIGACRYIISSDRQSAEFAISVSDDSRGKGLATTLMSILIEHAKSQELQTLFGDVLRNNKPMHALMTSLGFTGALNSEDHEIMIFSLDLNKLPEHIDNTTTP